MDDIVRALIDTYNAQLPEMYAFMPGIQVIIEGDWLGMLSDYADSSYNAVYDANFTSGNANQQVDKVVNLFKSMDRLPMTWFVVPTSRPENLGEILESKHFTHIARSPGMVLDIAREDLPAKLDNRHEIVRVSNLEQLAQWLVPGKDSFGMPDPLVNGYFELYKSQGFGNHLPWRLFLGTVDGRPVSCSRLFCHNGVAGIFQVATIPAARGLGYGTEITVAALEAGKQLGCKQAALVSSEAGHNVYLRLGFRDCCFGDIYLYKHTQISE